MVSTINSIEFFESVLKFFKDKSEKKAEISARSFSSNLFDHAREIARVLGFTMVKKKGCFLLEKFTAPPSEKRNDKKVKSDSDELLRLIEEAVAADLKEREARGEINKPF